MPVERTLGTEFNAKVLERSASHKMIDTGFGMCMPSPHARNRKADYGHEPRRNSLETFSLSAFRLKQQPLFAAVGSAKSFGMLLLLPDWRR